MRIFFFRLILINESMLCSLFIDTPILDAEIRRLQYPLYSNVLQSHPEPARYYHLHDEVKTFTEASATCRHFGGTLPDIYLHYDQRYMYHKLVNFTHCKKWFLGM